MKIKWRIALISIAIIVVLTSAIVGFSYVEVSNMVNDEKEVELKNYSSMGLKMVEKMYTGDWKLEGDKLYKGTQQLNENYDFIDLFTEDTGVLATVFAGDTRVSTNVKDDSGKRAISTKASQDVIDTVISQKKNYVGATDIQGTSALTYYVPLTDADGQVVGMWFVGTYTQDVNQKIETVMGTIIIISIILMIIGAAILYLLGCRISSGIKKVKDALHQLEIGDFTYKMDAKVLKQKDEVGEMANSTNAMIGTISDIIMNIHGASDTVLETTEQSVKRMDDIHASIEDISATTEQLSAGMEETSSSTEEMNASTIEIENEIQTMKEKTQNGEHLANEIKTRALKIKDETTTSQTNALEIYEETNRLLKQSIEKTKAIDEIRELSQTIMDITAQTNLLSLNAAIEAARAGEAGKGFSVVAEEIRVLAENSQKAVAKIDQITGDVSEAVESVVSDSTKLLDFVDNQVLKDYRSLVETSNQYGVDAEQVNSVVVEINDIAENLFETIQQLRLAIENITTASVEGAEGTALIADKVSAIAMKSNEVLEQTTLSKENVDSLDSTIRYFKV